MCLMVVPLMSFSSTLLLNIAIDRIISTQNFYDFLIKTRYTLYVSVHIVLGPTVTVSMEAVAYSGITSDLDRLRRIFVSSSKLHFFQHKSPAYKLCLSCCLYRLCSSLCRLPIL
uniref:7TM GPCR domain containing protein n=1 Tax=Haemonchus contortus TaxID=6289 RepID=A0A912MPL0_HAECO